MNATETQDNDIYDEATPTGHTYSSAGPNYDTVILDQPAEDEYSVLNHSSRTVGPSVPVVHSRTVEPSAPVVHSSSNSRTVEPSAPVVHCSSSRTVVVREEVPDQFHDTEQHIYAAVNKKHKKKKDLTTEKEAELEEIEYPNL